jgi:hypothetical protein
MAAPQADLGFEYLETLLSSLRVRTSRKRPSHGTTSECETGGLSHGVARGHEPMKNAGI